MITADDTQTAVSVDNLAVRFVTRERTLYAVNGVSFSLRQGEVLGVLGESGSGKSVTLKAMLRLLPGSAEISGAVRVGGDEIIGLPENAMERLRGSRISMIFQEPMTAFDPVFTIGEQIAETIVRHEGTSWRQAQRRALELLERVQIPSARQRLGNYPHEMSGGMRQRAMIALALACRPMVLLADEPTTALDVTVQMQVLLLLRELQREMGMAVIFVTHDIGVAFEISDRLAVMYAGRIVETGPAVEIARNAAHPYTRGLLRSTLKQRDEGERLKAIPGAPPVLSSAPIGCSFEPRCDEAMPVCASSLPTSDTVGSGHQVRCFRFGCAPSQAVSTSTNPGNCLG
ncbi:MAG: ABC transporter ATP-binding protein [Hyphomicrobiaceae bacterium]